MFKCIKNRKPVVVKPQHPTTEGTPMFFIVVGHNKKAQGATNYLGESEFYFNKRVGTKLQQKLDEFGIDAHLILRPTGSYGHQCYSVKSQIKEIGRLYQSYGINLHFNDAGESARGSEGWVKGTFDNFDDKLADNVTDMLEEIGIKQRGDDGVRVLKTSHNGYGMVNAMNEANCNTCLVEPCFGGYKTSESMAVFEHEDRYVDILFHAVVKTYKDRGYIE